MIEKRMKCQSRSVSFQHYFKNGSKNYTFSELFSMLYSLEKNAKNRRFFRKFEKYSGSLEKERSCQFFFAFF